MDAVTIVLAVGAVAGLHMAWLIGVRDGANAMGTSIGSGALTLRQALVVAVLFELLGALRAGGAVSETVAVRLVPLTGVGESSVELAAATAGGLVAAVSWLHAASALNWPVSSTHAVVGAMIGVGLWAGNVTGVDWAVALAVLAGWLASPLLAAAVGYALFVGFGRCIVRSRTPEVHVSRLGPVLAFGVFGALAFAVVDGGARTSPLLDRKLGWLVSLGVGLLAAVATRVAVRRRGEGNATDADRVEGLFAVLQVPTTSFVAFAHGSNDAANALGPMATVFGLVRGGVDAPAGQVAVPTNLLLIGAFGIVLGLSTFGLRLMETVGREVSELAPSRGFAAELAAAIVLASASILGLPISTTYTLVGAVVGVGLARGFGALDLGVVRGVLVSWVLTVPLTGALAAALAALSAFLLR